MLTGVPYGVDGLSAPFLSKGSTVLTAALCYVSFHTQGPHMFTPSHNLAPFPTGDCHNRSTVIWQDSLSSKGLLQHKIPQVHLQAAEGQGKLGLRFRQVLLYVHRSSNKIIGA